MTTTTSTFLTLVAAAVAGLGGGLVAQSMQPDRAAARAQAPQRTDAAVERRIDALAQRVDREIAALGERLDRDRLEPMERPSDREQAAAPEPSPGPSPAAHASPGGPVIALLEELGSGRRYTHRRSERLFRHLSRSHGEIATTIERLRAAIAEDPANPHLHAALGTALSAKTAFATPPGPQQGVVWKEAERAFQHAIELDPDHWEARYSLAFGDSMAPEFVGLRPRAIRRFEELMELQERQAPVEEHALVYRRLGTLYKDAGNAKRAREVWERGLRRFPEDRELRQSVQLLGED